MALETKDGRLGATFAAFLLTGAAAVGMGWALNSKIPPLKLATGVGGAFLGGLAILAIEDCREGRRYKKVAAETEYQEFLGYHKAELRHGLNYLLGVAPLPADNSQGQFPAVQFAALPPGVEEKPEEKPELNIRRLIKYPTIRVTGPQGAGKSRIVEELTNLRCEAGYKAIVIDPHCKYGQWEGLEVIGKGQDYQAIQRWIAWFVAEVKDRYDKRATDPNYDPPPLTVICEELTGWKSNGVKNAGKLEIISYSDTRKINIAILFVSHGKTAELMGGGKGMAKTREAGSADLELFAVIDQQSLEAAPKLEGILKLPSEEPQPVKIPSLPPLPPGTFCKYGKKAEIASTSAADGDNIKNRLTLEKLEKSYSAEPTADAIPPDEWEIIQIGIEKGELTIREAQRSAPGRRLKLEAASTKAMFQRWEELEIGAIQTNSKQTKFIFTKP